MTKPPFPETAIGLRNGVSFNLERFENRVRLVLCKGGEEWICLKEGFNNLYPFLKTENDRLFRGRLQLELNKDQNGIQISGKEAIVGSIGATWFKDRLDPLRTSSALFV